MRVLYILFIVNAIFTIINLAVGNYEVAAFNGIAAIVAFIADRQL